MNQDRQAGGLHTAGIDSNRWVHTSAWLCGAAYVTLISSVTAFSTGSIPLGLHLLLSIVALYGLSLSSHDAIHGTAHPNPAINRAIGWAATGVFFMPFSLFRDGHLAHHAHPGHDHDVEALPIREAWLYTPLLFVANFWYLRMLPARPAWERTLVLASAAFCAVAAAIAPTPMLLGWALPVQLTAGMFAYHHVVLPHSAARRRAGRIGRWIIRMHDHHHRRPLAPWHEVAWPVAPHPARAAGRGVQVAVRSGSNSQR